MTGCSRPKYSSGTRVWGWKALRHTGGRRLAVQTQTLATSMPSAADEPDGAKQLKQAQPVHRVGQEAELAFLQVEPRRFGRGVAAHLRRQLGYEHAKQRREGQEANQHQRKTDRCEQSPQRTQRVDVQPATAGRRLRALH